MFFNTQDNISDMSREALSGLGKSLQEHEVIACLKLKEEDRKSLVNDDL